MFARLLISLLFLSPLAGAETYTSVSRQFVIHYSGVPITIEKLPPGGVEVVPDLLAVTAERVKQAVTAEIPALANSRAIIHVGLLDNASPDGSIGIASSRFADGWRYEVAVPRVVEEARLVKAFINVLLLEYANRAGDRNAELPIWLSEGLAEQILHSIGPRLVVDRSATFWEATARDLNHWTREMLRTNTAPSFNELTTSPIPPRQSAGEPLYLASAHLLVHALLQMPNGRQRVANFLQTLPRTWNWQTAFLKSFNFENMLAVEKWWALTVIEFTTRDQRQAWSTDASLRKLDELLHTQLQYHSSSNALPETKIVDLNTILRETDLTLQRQALDEKISQLGYTAPYMAPQIGNLANTYKQILESYLQKRNSPDVQPGLRTTPAARDQSIISDTLRRLAALDAKRQSLSQPTLSSTR